MTTPWFGFHLPNFTFPGVPPERMFERVVELACAAESAGFAQVTVMDHFYQIRGVGPESDPMLEAYTLLGALAARTSKVRLGTMVTGVTYRHPAVLAKQITTLDVISAGRGMLGIGAAWNEDEHRGYGIEFPPIGERMNRLEEALTIAKAMFTEERATFHGRYYQIEDALNQPRPIEAAGPPIMVGGGGEQRTLRIAARFADMTHWFALPMDVLQHKTEVLARYCEEIGRDPSTIQRTVGAPFLLVETEAEAEAALEAIPADRRWAIKAVTPEQGAEALRPYLDAGFTGFTFGNSSLRDEASIQLAGRLLQLVA